MKNIKEILSRAFPKNMPLSSILRSKNPTFFHQEDLEIMNCPNCKKVQENCSWKGSILDHTWPTFGEIKEPFHIRYPCHSHSQMCEKHKQLFKE